MATTYYFDRDTKVYMHAPLAAAGAKNMFWELPVLDGFSFSQATNASEITLNQAQASVGGASLRARQMFNDSYAPAEWSFSTYMSPFTSAGTTIGTAGVAGDTDGDHHEVSEALWAMFFDQLAGNTYGITSTTSALTVNPDNSNKAQIGIFDLYFVFGAGKVLEASGVPAANYADGDQKIYRVKDCSVNEASFDFDIDGIATVAWSGQGKLITEESALNMNTGTWTIDGSDITPSTQLITEGVENTTGFIRNRVSDLTMTGAFASASAVTYSLVLTGGNITMSNNLTYLTPETLGIVNQPLGHVTGTRNIGGNVTCYLDNDDSPVGSAELFEDAIEATTDIQNVCSFAFDIGATAAPYLLLTMPTCHIEVPTIAIDDVISLETNFHALPSSISGTDEISVFNFIGKDVNA
jgi:hypothetical protein